MYFLKVYGVQYLFSPTQIKWSKVTQTSRILQSAAHEKSFRVEIYVVSEYLFEGLDCSNKTMINKRMPLDYFKLNFCLKLN